MPLHLFISLFILSGDYSRVAIIGGRHLLHNPCTTVYHISANRLRGVYLFCRSCCCGNHSRAGFTTLAVDYDRAAFTSSLASSPSKCVNELVRRYGSYKSRSRNKQNNSSQWARFGKCLSVARAQLHFLLAVALQQSDTHGHGATVTKLPDAIPFLP